MDTEKQRQCRRDDARLTSSGNARSEQLNTRSAYRVANQQSLACLSGSERRRPGWFLDMKYQTCYRAQTNDRACTQKTMLDTEYRLGDNYSQVTYKTMMVHKQLLIQYNS